MIQTEVTSGYYSQDRQLLHRTERKIRSFRELPQGWRYGEGVPFTQDALDRAVSLHRVALQLGFTDTDAFPGANGEIMLAIYAAQHCLEFTLEIDTSITYVHEQNDREVCYQEELTPQQAIARIEELKNELWMQSGSSTKATTIHIETDSSVSPSRTQELTPEYQSLVRSVYFGLRDLFVGTFASTTARSPVIYLSSGASRQTSFQTITS